MKGAQTDKQQPHYKMANEFGSKNIIVCHFVSAATRCWQ